MPSNQRPTTAQERQKTISILRRRIRAKERQGRKKKPAAAGRRDGFCGKVPKDVSDVDAPILPANSTAVKDNP